MYSLEAFGCVLFIALGAGILADQAVSGRQADETAVKRSKRPSAGRSGFM